MVGIAPERVDHLTGLVPPWQAPLALVTAALITTFAVLIVDVGVAGGASVHASLNLPLLSSQPCVVILAAMPLLFASGALMLLNALHPLSLGAAERRLAQPPESTAIM